MIPQPVGEVLTAKVRTGGRSGQATADGIQMKVWMKTGILEQILCEVVTSLLPECIIELDITSDWTLLPQTNIIKQKASKSALTPVLTGLARLEPGDPPAPTQVVTVEQYGTPGG